MSDDLYSKYINLRETLGEEHRETYIAWGDWASSLTRAEAIPEFEEMLDYVRRIYGPDHHETFYIWLILIQLNDGYSSYAVVEDEYRKLYKASLRVYGPTYDFTKDIEYRWKFALRKLNHSIRANEMLRKEREE